MSAFTKVSIADLASRVLISLDTFTVSQALMTLQAFIDSDATCEQYQVDASAYDALRRAACKVTNTPKDSKRNVVQYVVKSSKTGRDTWTNLRKNQDVPKGAKTRTIEQRGYSSEQRAAGVKAVRDSFGVEIKRIADRTPIERDEALYFVVLSRSAS